MLTAAQAGCGSRLKIPVFGRDGIYGDSPTEAL